MVRRIDMVHTVQEAVAMVLTWGREGGGAVDGEKVRHGSHSSGCCSHGVDLG